MSNLKVVFFGTPDYVVPIVDTLHKHFQILGVVTKPPKPSGRGQQLTPSPVSDWAKRAGVPILDGALTETINQLSKMGPEVGVLESYGEILSPEMINIFPHGIVNVHPSLLPKYRGSSPIQAVILSGDKVTGITAIKLDSQMDHGPILAQQAYPVKHSDTFKSLREELFSKSAQLLVKSLPKYINGQVQLRPQDDTQATYTWKTGETRAKAYFDITNPPSAEQLDRMIRAFDPWPSAWTRWKDQIVKFFPGQQIQIEGRNRVDLEQFIQGYPDFPLKQL